MTPSDTKINYKLASTMTTLRNVHPEMSIQMAHVFFLCALNQGESLTYIANLTNYPLPSMSRKVSDLGARNREGKPGLGLVETKIDPTEFRKKQIYLTSRGSALMADIVAIWRS